MSGSAGQMKEMQPSDTCCACLMRDGDEFECQCDDPGCECALLMEAWEGGIAIGVDPIYLGTILLSVLTAFAIVSAGDPQQTRFLVVDGLCCQHPACEHSGCT